MDKDKVKLLGFESIIYECWRPDAFLSRITSDFYIDLAKEYTYIILGEGGPTGKTWLTHELKQRGFKAFEITEDIYDLVFYYDSCNHYTVDHTNKQVVIVLNKRLEGGYGR